MGKYGVIDSRNNILVPVICDTIILMSMHPFPRDGGMEYFDPLSYGLLKADNKYGVINLFSQEVPHHIVSIHKEKVIQLSDYPNFLNDFTPNISKLIEKTKA